MFKKLLLAAVTLMAMEFALAQVEVNTADQAALDGVKGIGPSLSTTILDERKKGGNFKDWTDFQARVKGVGPAGAGKLSQAGLTIDGQSRSVIAKEAKTPPKAAPKETASDSRADAKKSQTDRGAGTGLRPD